MDTWTLFGLAALAGFVMVYFFAMRWVFRVNEQISYLRQICEELMKLNAREK